MKRNILALIILSMLLSTGHFTAPASAVGMDTGRIEDINVVVDGNPVDLSGVPFFIDESYRLQVGLTESAGLFGIEYELYNQGTLLEDPDSAVFTAYGTFSGKTGADGRRVTMSAGDYRMYVDGDEIPMDTSPVYRDGVFYVPLRYIAEAFDYVVEWDAENSSIYIYYGILDLDGMNINYYYSSGGRDDITYPYAVVIRSVGELAAYRQSGMEFFDRRFDSDGGSVVHPMETAVFLNTDNYNEAFFSEHFLIFVLLRESSGSVSHKISSVTIPVYFIAADLY